MIVFAYEVPSPKQVVGFRQLILPFKPLVWYLTSKSWKNFHKITFLYNRFLSIIFSCGCNIPLDYLCFDIKTLPSQPKSK